MIHISRAQQWREEGVGQKMVHANDYDDLYDAYSQQAAIISQLREMLEACCYFSERQEFLAAATVIRYRETLAAVRTP